MKYALIIDNIVDTVSEVPVEGWEQVDNNVYGGMVKKSDGTFDLSDEAKQRKEQVQLDIQAKADLKASAKAKLVAGEPLTEEEANVVIGG